MSIGLPAEASWVSVTSQKAGRPVIGGRPGGVKLPVLFSEAESTVTRARCRLDCR